MKGIFIHISALALASYFLLAGLGYNVVNYCCETCAHHGIYEVAKHSCDEFHSHDQCSSGESHKHSENNNSDATCSNLSHLPKSCHLLRINVEPPTFVAEKLTKVEMVTLELFFPIYLNIIQYEELTNSYCDSSPPPYIPLKAGRMLLAEKSVLII